MLNIDHQLSLYWFQLRPPNVSHRVIVSSASLLRLRHWGLLGTADGVSRSRLGVQSGVSRRGDDQIVTVPLVPLETAPESMPRANIFIITRGNSSWRLWTGPARPTQAKWVRPHWERGGSRPEGPLLLLLC